MYDNITKNVTFIKFVHNTTTASNNFFFEEKRVADAYKTNSDSVLKMSAIAMFIHKLKKITLWLYLNLKILKHL